VRHRTDREDVRMLMWLAAYHESGLNAGVTQVSLMLRRSLNSKEYVMKKLHLCASAFVLSMSAAGLSATSAQAGCSRPLAADVCIADVTRPSAHEASNANPDNGQAREQFKSQGQGGNGAPSRTRAQDGLELH
jgi:hypothetical protein